MATDATAVQHLRRLFEELKADSADWTTQLGVLFAAVEGVLDKTNASGAAAVRRAASLDRLSPDVLVEIDQMRTVRPDDLDVPVSADDLETGINAAVVGLHAIPDGDPTDDAWRRTMSRHTGAMVGFLTGLMTIHGFADDAWDTREHAHRATVELGETLAWQGDAQAESELPN